MKLVSSFKDRLKEASDGRSLTEIAASIGLSKQAISAYITGTRVPKRPTVVALANLLNVDVCWLFGYDVPKIPAMPEKLVTAAREVVEDKQLLDLFHQLNPQGKASLTNYARFLTSQPEYLEKNSESGNVEERA